MKTLKIQIDKTNMLLIDTDRTFSSKLDMVEFMLMVLITHYRKKKPEELDVIMGILNSAYEESKRDGGPAGARAFQEPSRSRKA